MGGRVARAVGARLAVVGVALGVSVLLAGPAAAHNSLTSSNPANGARLAKAPAVIELRFLARLDPATTKITITGPDNVPAAGGAPTYAGSRVTVPLRAGAAGLYVVDYRVPSSDGHPITGEVRFTLTAGTAAAPPSGGAAPSASTRAPVPPSPTASSPTDPVGSATPAADERRASGWLWSLVALAVVTALAVTTLILRRRGTRR